MSNFMINLSTIHISLVYFTKIIKKSDLKLLKFFQMLTWFNLIQIVGYLYETLRDMTELITVSPVILELDNSDGLGSSIVGRF